MHCSDIYVYNAIACQNGSAKRKAQRDVKHHNLRKQLPKFVVKAMEEKFAEILAKNMVPAGVTHALRTMHGSHCFTYPFCELQNLWYQFKKRQNYRENQANRVRNTYTCIMNALTTHNM